MSKEKQIEEIVNELIFCGNANKGVIAEHLYVKGYRKQDTFAFERPKDMEDIIKPYVSGLACDQESGSCELTDCRSCNARRLATELYDAGYRKQSEGEWKLGKSGCMYFCSSCGYAAHPREVDEWTHCPKCGTKMKGE